MKNKKIWMGMLVIVLAFSMAVIACDNNGDDTGPTGGNAGIPGTADGSLRFENQQVWTYDWRNDRWAHFTGSRTGITCSNFGGTGAITNGRFNFTLTSDDIENGQLRPLEDSFGWIVEEGGTISVEGVMTGRLDFEGDDFGLWRVYGSFREVSNGYNFTEEEVRFLYVDRAVTISHPGFTDEGRETYDGITEIWNFTTRAFSVDLQQGWNALRWHVTFSFRETATSATWNETATLYVGNPARLRWVISEWNDHWDDWSAEAFSAHSAQTEARPSTRHGGSRPVMFRGR